MVTLGSSTSGLVQSFLSSSVSAGQLTPRSEDLEGEWWSLPLNPLSRQLSCAWCPAGRKKDFGSFQALQDHLCSPAHAPKMFHCPLSLLSPSTDRGVGYPSKAMKCFSTLSGLTQYLETGACTSKMIIFQRAIEFVENELRQIGLRQSPLLK